MDDQTQEGQAPSQQNQGEDQTQKSDPSDTLTPEHPRFKQVIEKLHEKDQTIDQLKAEMEELKSEIKNRQASENTNVVSPEEQAALDKIDREFKKRGYVTKTELEEQTRVEKRASTLTSLSKEYDGKNGYPKFVADDVVTYARKNGFGDNYAAAYRDMHFDAIVQVNSRRQGVQVPGSEYPSGGERNAPNLGISADDISKMSDAEYEKNRDKILSAIRPR